MNTIVAIDIAKDKSSYVIGGTENKKTKVPEFPMTYKGFDSLLEETSKFSDPCFFMESTGRYHLTLLHFLLNHQQNAVIVNPVLVKHFSKANTLRKTKTDAIDATMIAKFAQNNLHSFKKAEYGLPEEIRAIARRREQLAEEVSKAKTQIKADLCVAFPEILTVDVFTVSMLQFLSVYSSPKLILAATDEELTAALQQKGRGRGAGLSSDDIRQKARDSVGIDSYATLAQDSVKHLLSIQTRQEAVTKVLLEYMQRTHQKEQKILESIPGIGTITAAHFMAEIDDINRFERYQKLIAFCGTDPAVYESGTISKQGRITKHGNKSLRKYVYLMASGVMKFNPYFKAYYDKKRKSGFPHRKAMVALMNKLLKTIFALLTKGELFVVPK